MASSRIWLPSQAYTVSPQTSADIETQGAKGLVVHLDITAVSTLSLTLTVSMKDIASGVYEAISTLGQTAIVATGHTVFTVAPLTALTAAPVANTQTLAFAMLTEFIQLKASFTGSGTFSVGYDLI